MGNDQNTKKQPQKAFISTMVSLSFPTIILSKPGIIWRVYKERRHYTHQNKALKIFDVLNMKVGNGFGFPSCGK